MKRKGSSGSTPVVVADHRGLDELVGDVVFV